MLPNYGLFVIALFSEPANSCYLMGLFWCLRYFRAGDFVLPTWCLLVPANIRGGDLMLPNWCLLVPLLTPTLQLELARVLVFCVTFAQNPE
jgi:hypothetical protein